jgi:hypothetical protein
VNKESSISSSLSRPRKTTKVASISGFTDASQPSSVGFAPNDAVTSSPAEIAATPAMDILPAARIMYEAYYAVTMDSRMSRQHGTAPTTSIVIFRSNEFHVNQDRELAVSMQRLCDIGLAEITIHHDVPGKV